MRIRKRQVPLPLSSLSPAPVSLSDPHIIYRSWGVVQLDQNSSMLQTPTAISVTAKTPTVSASTSASPKPKPSSISCPQQNLSPLLMEDSIVGSTTIFQLDRQLSDHHQTSQTFGKATNGPDSSCPSWPHNQEGNQNSCLELLPMENGKKQEKDKSNHSRERVIVVSGAASKALPLSSPPQGVQAVDGRWWDGETAFPLKKRRGSLENKVKEETAMESNKKMKTSRMKTKMNNKWSVQNEVTAPEGGEQEGEEKDVVKLVVNNVNRKRVRGTTLLRGSRCSRVNGRGWRCCQQTLVGYSLCEHHLGKGRLRSMTSVRSSSSLGSSSSNGRTSVAAAPKRKKSTPDQTSTTIMPFEPSSSSPEKSQPPSSTTGYECNEVEDEDHHEDEMTKPLLKRKKTMKLGMVKARSISSLLGQTNNEIFGSSTANLK